MQQAGILLYFFLLFSPIFYLFLGGGEEQIQPSLAASVFAAARSVPLIPRAV